MTLVSNADFPLRRRSAASAKRAGYSETGKTHPRRVSDKDIWVWTGYKLDDLNAAQMQVVDLINVLVDGKFVQDLKTLPDLARQQQSGGASFAMISSLLPECRQQGNEELTILLVIGVAGRFQLLCGSLRFFTLPSFASFSASSI